MTNQPYLLPILALILLITNSLGLFFTLNHKWFPYKKKPHTAHLGKRDREREREKQLL